MDSCTSELTVFALLTSPVDVFRVALLIESDRDDDAFDARTPPESREVLP